MLSGDGVEVADGAKVTQGTHGLPFAAKVDFEVETFRRATETGFEILLVRIRQDCNAKGSLHSSICANELADAFADRAKCISSLYVEKCLKHLARSNFLLKEGEGVIKDYLFSRISPVYENASGCINRMWQESGLQKSAMLAGAAHRCNVSRDVSIREATTAIEDFAVQSWQKKLRNRLGNFGIFGKPLIRIVAWVLGFAYRTK